MPKSKPTFINKKSVFDLEKLRDKAAESCILSSVINDHNLLAKFNNQIREWHFATSVHKYIWRAIIELHQNKKPVDIIGIRNQLRTETDLSDNEITNRLNDIVDIVIAPLEEDLEEYISIVVNFYNIRKMVLMSKGIINEAGRGTSYEKIKELLSKNNVIPVASSINVDGKNRPENVNSIIDLANKESEKAIEEGIERSRGIPTGLSSLTKYITFRPKNTYIVASRPGHGKTSLGLSMSYNLAKMGYKIGWIALEMDKESMVEKLICQNAMISNDDFRALHESKKIEMRNNLKEAFSGKLNNIIIDDTVINLDGAVNSIYSMYQAHKIDIFMFDYLQLCYIKDFDGNRNTEIERISRKFKVVSTKLMIPGLIFSQLNRGVEQRSNKRPVLSDLRNSGAIEQDATAAISIYRAEEYGIMQDAKGRSTEFKAELGIMKNRYGKKGIIRTNFIKDYAYFTDDRSDVEECKIKEGYYE